MRKDDNYALTESDAALFRAAKKRGHSFAFNNGWRARQETAVRAGYFERTWRFSADRGGEIPAYVLTDKGLNALEEYESQSA